MAIEHKQEWKLSTPIHSPYGNGKSIKAVSSLLITKETPKDLPTLRLSLWVSMESAASADISVEELDGLVGMFKEAREFLKTLEEKEA